MAEPRPFLCITLACSPRAGEVVELTLQLPAGASIADAVEAAGGWQALGFAQEGPAGLWGRSAPLT
ncbi:hypothetical protein ACN9OL_12145, partial [Glaesserella parasuis]